MKILKYMCARTQVFLLFFSIINVMSSLNEELRFFSVSLGVDLFGVADLSNAKQYITNQGGEHVGQFPRAVSLGIRLIDDVIDQLHWQITDNVLAFSQYGNNGSRR